MILDITGSSKVKREMVKDLLFELTETPLHNDVLNYNLDLTVNIIKNLDGDAFTTYHLIPDDDEDIHVVTIDLHSSLIYEDIALALSHELIHVKQFLTERLKYIDGTIFLFDGVHYDTSKVPYDDLPWEIEAYASENLILH